MLITQRSHWTPCSLEAPFWPGHSRILWLLVTTLQGLWLTGRSDGAADGKERQGTGAPPSALGRDKEGGDMFSGPSSRAEGH